MLVDGIYVLLGCMFLSFAITVILKPNNLITGGITGLSIVLEKMIGIPYTWMYYGLSMVVLFTTYLTLGKKEARKILLLSILFPVMLILFDHIFEGSPFNLTKGDMFLSSIYYGILGGIGVGFFFIRGYSSGGTDSIAKILHIKLFPFVSVSQLMACLDIIVLCIGILVFDVRTALYAVLTQLVFMKSVEAVLYGFSSKLVNLEILSEEVACIEQFILTEVGRGVTKYPIVGAYSNLTRTKLVTICSQRESMLIKQKIAEVDQRAFVSVNQVSSVWGIGVGFDSLTGEE
jgi:uncharacterized membrane-anchored protein YitT (DUF2179 family)